MTSKLVDDAKALAFYLHRNQRDKAGRPYFEHLEAVAQRADYYAQQQGFGWGRREVLIAAGYLHDSIEDQRQTTMKLLGYGLPHEVADLVGMMTRYYNRRLIGWQDHEAGYYRRLRSSADGLILKRADLWHNTLPERLALLGPDQQDRLWARYLKAHCELGLIPENLDMRRTFPDTFEVAR